MVSQEVAEIGKFLIRSRRRGPGMDLVHRRMRKLPRVAGLVANDKPAADMALQEIGNEH